METWGDSDGVVEAAETPWTFDQSGVSDFISLPVKPCSQSNTAAERRRCRRRRARGGRM